jgi:hypothetical protein
MISPAIPKVCSGRVLRCLACTRQGKPCCALDSQSHPHVHATNTSKSKAPHGPHPALPPCPMKFLFFYVAPVFSRRWCARNAHGHKQREHMRHLPIPMILLQSAHCHCSQEDLGQMQLLGKFQRCIHALFCSHSKHTAMSCVCALQD